MNTVIETAGLIKRYGQRRGLDGLDLAVNGGEVYGFLGPNGAGKTTTIRILLDLIRPTRGSATVLGMTPAESGPQLRRRVGYLPGDFPVGGRQSGRQLLTHLGHLRGGVPAGRIESLAERFELDLAANVGSLSKGNRQKVGVIQAFMHEPELLILDEPTSGLDPLMQQRFLELVRAARHNGQTVFMSSHVLSEVQQSADRVGIVRAGRLVTVESVEQLRARALRRVEAIFDGAAPADTLAGVEGVSNIEIDGNVFRCGFTGHADGLVKALARHTVATLTIKEPDLEELFFAYYGKEPVDAE
jgi:ABC-2 type transport system ATP-binding protein